MTAWKRSWFSWKCHQSLMNDECVILSVWRILIPMSDLAPPHILLMICLISYMRHYCMRLSASWLSAPFLRPRRCFKYQGLSDCKPLRHAVWRLIMAIWLYPAVKRNRHCLVTMVPYHCQEWFCDVMSLLKVSTLHDLKSCKLWNKRPVHPCIFRDKPGPKHPACSIWSTNPHWTTLLFDR